ncbi:MAG: glycoside hydrolase family 2 TIM barrel-domain containing protein [Verrucomicrobiota bacterium]
MILRTIRNTLLRLVLVAFCLGLAAADETQRVYLSGHGKDDAVPWRFMCTTGALSGFWTNIPVPSNWDVTGFGHLTYKKDYSNSITECGLYEKDFTAPKKWKDQRVFLVFEGAMTDTSAKLNGQSVGPTHQGGFYRFKYEVTDKLKLGAENKLEVTVAKHSANESVNKAERLADYWVFGGIFRPVYLEVVPQQFIERVVIDARADGAFAMDVFLNGMTDADAVEAQIVTIGGEKVGERFGVPALAGPNRLKAELRTQIASPRLWTAETPNLYRVEVRLKRGKQVLHEFTERFGFRTFEVRDGDGLYLNGQKIILKGVNRHSFWPDSGRCLSTAVHKLDITTIKEMNGNAVRMSHYPPDKEFLELCDELGLYVLNELAGWHNSYDTDIGTKLVEEMVTRDVNHPSILFWDNGNEGGSNPELDRVFHEFDPQKRRVLHPWGLHSGLNTAHYLAYTNAEVAAAGHPMYYHPKEQQELLNTNLPSGWIYMPTEFMHGLYDGGAGAGLEDYWRMMMSYSNCAGGFIWVFADEGIKNPHTGKLDTAGNQAPDGIVGPYREREGSFYVIKDIWGGGNPKPVLGITNEFQPPLGRSGCARNIYDLNDFRDGQDVLVEFDGIRLEGKTGRLLSVERQGKRFALNAGPRLTMTNAVFSELRWELHDNGWLQCDYKYTATGTQDVFGVVFDYPENLVKKKRWLGDGPFRVWKNRLGGGKLGVWENDYNTTITGYSGWKYPEFKGCFSNVRWLQLETTEGLITVVPENIPYVQVLTPEQPPDNLIGKTKVNLPQCGLGFLHAIPPIGTKFKPAAASGPQSQPNVGQGEYSGRVSFYFGKLP